MEFPTNIDHAHLPYLIDQIATASPHRPWMVVPETSDVKGKWRTIDFAELAKAVDGASRWVEKTIGIPESQRETVGYLGLHDVRYGIIMFALMKTNHRALILSRRNSNLAQIHIMRTTDCTRYLYTEGVTSNLEVFRARPDEFYGFQVPTLQEMIALGEQGPGPFPCYGGVSLEEKVVVMHSSGSTGVPKPIYVDNVWISNLLRQKHLVPPPGRRNRSEGWLGPSTDGKALITSAPMYHGMALLLYLRSIFTGPLVVLPAGLPISAEIVMEAIERGFATCGMFPPSIIADLSATTRGLQALSTLDEVFYGGAPLSRSAGNLINSVTRLSSIIGSVETCCLPALAPLDRADWDYFEFHPYAGVTMEHVEDNLAEMIIRPLGDLRQQPVFYNFPGISEWRTNDLFEEHPARTGLWRFKCRRDDLLVLSNGLKFDPIMFEKTVEDHPFVTGAIVVGHDRFQPGLIVEVDEGRIPTDHLSFLEHVWPIVEMANKPSSTHARIEKSMIAFANKDKPFARTAKHSIAKRATLDLYAPEIEALYSPNRVDQQLSVQLGKLDVKANLTELRNYLRQALRLLLGDLPEIHSDDDDLFKLKMDSQNVLALSKLLRNGLTFEGNQVVVPVADIYTNPTINTLASSIHRKLMSDEHDVEPRERESLILHLVEKYTAGLAGASVSLADPPELHTAILTGSTGSLGSYILEKLIESGQVQKVYCLNRSEDAGRRQKQSFAERGIHAELSKVSFLHADFSLPRFGLSLEAYDELVFSATIFIHNAWAVNFNHSLESFVPTHITGTRHVVDFSLQSKHRCHISFISSIASVAGYSGIVPEAIVERPSAAANQGYGASKYVAERILGAAAAVEVPVSIFRCGQIAGPQYHEGCWNRQEWFPSLVLTSASMGAIPLSLGDTDDIDWLPVDSAAQAIVECTLSNVGRFEAQSPDVFHIINPKTGSWRGLVPVIQELYRREQGIVLEAVAFDDWVAALKRVPLTREQVEIKPGLKLIGFYESMAGLFPVVDIQKTIKYSKSLAESRPVDEALLKKWLRHWI